MKTRRIGASISWCLVFLEIWQSADGTFSIARDHEGFRLRLLGARRFVRRKNIATATLTHRADLGETDVGDLSRINYEYGLKSIRRSVILYIRSFTGVTQR
jgi:hypothetical protein